MVLDFEKGKKPGAAGDGNLNLRKGNPTDSQTSGSINLEKSNVVHSEKSNVGSAINFDKPKPAGEVAVAAGNRGAATEGRSVTPGNHVAAAGTHVAPAENRVAPEHQAWSSPDAERGLPKGESKKRGLGILKIAIPLVVVVVLGLCVYWGMGQPGSPATPSDEASFETAETAETAPASASEPDVGPSRDAGDAAANETAPASASEPDVGPSRDAGDVAANETAPASASEPSVNPPRDAGDAAANSASSSERQQAPTELQNIDVSNYPAEYIDTDADTQSMSVPESALYDYQSNFIKAVNAYDFNLLKDSLDPAGPLYKDQLSLVNHYKDNNIKARFIYYSVNSITERDDGNYLADVNEIFYLQYGNERAVYKKYHNVYLLKFTENELKLSELLSLDELESKAAPVML